MIDPTSYAIICLEKRKSALYHIQIELDRHAVRQSMEERTAPLVRSFYHSVNVPIYGRVVRSFGFRRRFWQKGAALFSMPVLSPQGGMLGGIFGIPQKGLLQATHMEAYLNKEGGELIAYEFKLLENGPTTRPVMTLKEIEDCLTRWEKKTDLPPNKWWEFWKDRPSVRDYKERSARRRPKSKPATILGLGPPPRHRLR